MNTYMIGDLIIFLAKQLKTESEKKLKSFDLGIGQLQVLLLFYEIKPQAMTQSSIAKTLQIDKGNVSRLVKKLINKDYLAIAVPGKIKNELILTETGLNMKQEILSSFRAIYQEMTNGISQEELEMIESVMNKMKTNME